MSAEVVCVVKRVVKTHSVQIDALTPPSSDVQTHTLKHTPPTPYTLSHRHTHLTHTLNAHTHTHGCSGTGPGPGRTGRTGSVEDFGMEGLGLVELVFITAL